MGRVTHSTKRCCKTVGKVCNLIARTLVYSIFQSCTVLYYNIAIICWATFCDHLNMFFMTYYSEYLLDVNPNHNMSKKVNCIISCQIHKGDGSFFFIFTGSFNTYILHLSYHQYFCD